MIMARTDCRPTQGIDEAVARIEMFVEEGADMLFSIPRPTKRRSDVPLPPEKAVPRSRCCPQEHLARRLRVTGQPNSD